MEGFQPDAGTGVTEEQFQQCRVLRLTAGRESGDPAAQLGCREGGRIDPQVHRTDILLPCVQGVLTEQPYPLLRIEQGHTGLLLGLLVLAWGMAYRGTLAGGWSRALLTQTGQYGSLLLAATCVLGSLIGTRLALKHGAGFVRRVFIFVVLALIVKTAWDTWFRTL